jgi:hypothetical protein
MPPETLERIAALASEGGTLLVQDELPRNVPGLSRLGERRARLRAAQATLGQSANVTIGSDVRELLQSAGIKRESLTDAGLEFVRRRSDAGYIYFIANPGTDAVSGWFPLCGTGTSAVLMDAMTGAVGAAATKTGADGQPEVYLVLPAGASLLLRTQFGASAEEIAPWQYGVPAETGTLTLSEGWSVEFLEGGPSLPAVRFVPSLSDWTQWDTAVDGDREALRAFSGTARYTVRFDLPAGFSRNIAWSLDLGVVCHSAVSA